MATQVTSGVQPDRLAVRPLVQQDLASRVDEPHTSGRLNEPMHIEYTTSISARGRPDHHFPSSVQYMDHETLHGQAAMCNHEPGLLL